MPVRMDLKKRRLLRINRTYYEIKDGAVEVKPRRPVYCLDTVAGEPILETNVTMRLDNLTNKQRAKLQRQFKRHKKLFSVGVWQRIGRKQAREDCLLNLLAEKVEFNRKAAFVEFRQAA